MVGQRTKQHAHSIQRCFSVWHLRGPLGGRGGQHALPAFLAAPSTWC
jgi:hypothetical protein